MKAEEYNGSAVYATTLYQAGLEDVHKIINFQLGNSSPPHRRLGGRYRVRLCVLVVAWEEDN